LKHWASNIIQSVASAPSAPAGAAPFRNAADAFVESPQFASFATLSADLEIDTLMSHFTQCSVSLIF
jgi:hypothetical protein